MWHVLKAKRWKIRSLSRILAPLTWQLGTLSWLITSLCLFPYPSGIHWCSQYACLVSLSYSMHVKCPAVPWTYQLCICHHGSCTPLVDPSTLILSGYLPPDFNPCEERDSTCLGYTPCLQKHLALRSLLREVSGCRGTGVVAASLSPGRCVGCIVKMAEGWRGEGWEGRRQGWSHQEGEDTYTSLYLWS